MSTQHNNIGKEYEANRLQYSRVSPALRTLNQIMQQKVPLGIF